MSAPSTIVTRHSYRPKNASYTEEEKTLTLHRVNDLGWSATKAAKKLTCTTQTVLNWLEHKENNKPLHDFSHRPPNIHPNKKEELMEEIQKKRKKGQAMSRAELHKKLQRKVTETHVEANKAPKIVTGRYTRDFINENQLHTGNAEVITNAHEIAEDDPRHAVSFAALLHHLHKHVPRGQFINMDKTAFDYIKNAHENEKAVYLGKREQSFKVPTPKSARPKGNCSVPMYIIASDGGKIADVIYLIKDNTMKTDQIDTYSVPMLDVSNGAETSAHLIFHGDFTKNTDAALEWIYTNVLVKFADSIRKGPGRDPTSCVSLTVDGDPRQLQVTAGENVIGLFSRAKIIVGKSPASCTPIFQPLDAGKLFLAAKTRFTKIIESGIPQLNEEDMNDLKSIFQEHRRKYPVKTCKNGAASTAVGPHFTDVMICLAAAAAALREVPVHRVVTDSFRDTGVSPFSPSIIRSKCTYQWTTADEAKFDAAVPVLSTKMGVNFELKENDYDELELPVNNKSKDGVVVHSRRALLLHGPDIVRALYEQADRT